MWDNNTVGVYLAVATTDTHKQINGLSILMQETMELDPFSGSVYVFCNPSAVDRKGDILGSQRILSVAEAAGKDRFRWSETREEVVRISSR